MHGLGIDVGGSGIKGGLVDLATGELIDARVRIATPKGFEFDGVVETIAEVANQLGSSDSMGVGFPAVVRRGVISSPPTAFEFEGWVGRDLAAALADCLGGDVRVANDADVAGIAEMRFGAGVDCPGVVVVLTLGTGVGSAVFNDGVLLPNTELGKLYLQADNDVAELHMASRVRKADKLSWPEWAARLNTYLHHVDRLFSPDLIILGGGVSKDAGKYVPELDIDCDVVPAALRNHAGIAGAAVMASTA